MADWARFNLTNKKNCITCWKTQLTIIVPNWFSIKPLSAIKSWMAALCRFWKVWKVLKQVKLKRRPLDLPLNILILWAKCKQKLLPSFAFHLLHSNWGRDDPPYSCLYFNLENCIMLIQWAFVFVIVFVSKFVFIVAKTFLPMCLRSNGKPQ